MIIRDTWNSDAEASQQKYSELENEYQQLNQTMSAEVGGKSMQISRLENAIKVSVNSELLFPSGGWDMPSEGEGDHRQDGRDPSAPPHHEDQR